MGGVGKGMALRARLTLLGPLQALRVARDSRELPLRADARRGDRMLTLGGQPSDEARFVSFFSGKGSRDGRGSSGQGYLQGASCESDGDVVGGAS